jgi:hypothetical protein
MVTSTVGIPALATASEANRALLGFEGFFDRFVVKFDGPARTFEVSPTRPEDVKA